MSEFELVPCRPWEEVDERWRTARVERMLWRIICSLRSGRERSFAEESVLGEMSCEAYWVPPVRSWGAWGIRSSSVVPHGRAGCNLEEYAPRLEGPERY